MKAARRIFVVPQLPHVVKRGDLIVLGGLAGLIAIGVTISARAPRVTALQEITLAPAALPLYAVLSLTRMSAAYGLSMAFALTYGGLAARSKRMGRVLLPVLDVLQTVPILSFLPVVLLSLSAVLPQRLAAELASVVLIFTSQVWNITFSWYQSLSTVPAELKEAGVIFRFNTWLRFRTLLLPFGLIGLIWNSVMGWAGGWFFLMAAEMFAVGDRNFRLPGLGAYLQAAANQGNAAALLWGLGTLTLVIVVLDQLVWRPLLAWSDRFKVELVAGERPPTSWLLDAFRSSRLAEWLRRRWLAPLVAALDERLGRSRSPAGRAPEAPRPHDRWTWAPAIMVGLVALYGIWYAGGYILHVAPGDWGQIVVGLLATALRVAAALAISLAWTLPAGVAIGTHPRAAAWLQPIVQIAASLPATAFFPVLLLLLARWRGGLDVGAVLLMLMGTQWYLLFNIIAGASAIPQDLKYTAALLQLSRWERWRTLLLPALFPYLITGAIAAGGGAWNASIVAEYAQFGGRTVRTVGIGATIASATAAGNYALFYAATTTLILAVVAINRLLWRRLYRLAESRYRLD